MLGCSTDLDNSDRSVCRSVDGEREKSINSVFYYCAVRVQQIVYQPKDKIQQATIYEPFYNFSL